MDKNSGISETHAALDLQAEIRKLWEEKLPAEERIHRASQLVFRDAQRSAAGRTFTFTNRATPLRRRADLYVRDLIANLYQEIAKSLFANNRIGGTPNG